jgi:anhydro-N-acetylmuramic acid kinase
MVLQDLCKKPSRRIVGLMSGTSADSIDVAICSISGTGISDAQNAGAQVTLEHFYVHPYPSQLSICMKRIKSLTVQEVAELQCAFGDLFAEACLAGLKSAGLTKTDIDLIGSHGQTIYHHSSVEGSTICTLQLGDGDRIAVQCETPVVYDFRAKDIAVGGEGAPLTPYADAVFFRSLVGGGFVVLNLGGIANISAFDSTARKILGFDTGPANAPLDRLAEHLSARTLRYDEDGRFAAAGKVNQQLLKELLEQDLYLKKVPPKSTGFEMYGDKFVEYLIGCSKGQVDIDLIATVTEFVARSIAESIRRFVPYVVDRIIVAGGGRRNRFLLDRIAAHAAPIVLMTSDDLGIPSDAREAMAFALFANEAIFGTPSSLPSVTGASRKMCLGKFALP